MKLKIFLIISIMVLAGVLVATWPDGKVRVIFCDVGQGDGILLAQNNFEMLIDTGPENMKMVQCLEKHLPFWDKTIEAVVLTHSDSDHSGGLKQIRNYYKINEQNIYSWSLRKDDILKYGSIVYEVLSPSEDWGNENDNSTVGVLKVKDMSFLLMGDVTSNVEQKLVWRKELLLGDGLKPSRTILKISHHGSVEATSQELLEAVKPVEAIISVGKNNRFGHPTKVVLDKLNRAGVKIWRTDEQGEREFDL